MTAMWERITDRPGLKAVNLDEFLCPGGVCPAKFGEIITRRDNQHLTLDYAAAIIEQLEGELRRQGVDLQTGKVT